MTFLEVRCATGNKSFDLILL